MQGINHVVFGSLIGLTVTHPAAAVPLALASHFALDSVPHYGEHHRTQRGTWLYHVRTVADVIASFAFVLWILSLHPPNPGLIAACAIAAILPDLLWPVALFVKRTGIWWAFFRFHKLIQRESPWGIYIEIVWFLVTGSLVYRLAVY